MTRQGTVVLILSLLGSVAVCQAQEATQPTGAGGVAGLVEGSLRLTGIAGGAAWMAGGAVGLGLGERTFITGEGTTVLQKVALDGTSPARRATFGYGGVALERLFGSIRPHSLGVSVFVGAGRARTEDSVSGFEAGSTNVLVLRPSISLRRPLYAFLTAGLTLGYRQVWGADELPGLAAGDLNAITASVSLRALRRE